MYTSRKSHPPLIITSRKANTSMELATRSYFNAGLAFTTAATIAFTPAALYAAPPLHVSLLHISTTPLTLTTKVTSADVKALVANLEATMSSVSDTVTSLAGLPGQTIAQALITRPD